MISLGFVIWYLLPKATGSSTIKSSAFPVIVILCCSVYPLPPCNLANAPNLIFACPHDDLCFGGELLVIAWGSALAH